MCLRPAIEGRRRSYWIVSLSLARSFCSICCWLMSVISVRERWGRAMEEDDCVNEKLNCSNITKRNNGERRATANLPLADIHIHFFIVQIAKPIASTMFALLMPAVIDSFANEWGRFSLFLFRRGFSSSHFHILHKFFQLSILSLILTISLFQSHSCSWTYIVIIFCAAAAAAAAVGLMTLDERKGNVCCFSLLCPLHICTNFYFARDQITDLRLGSFCRCFCCTSWTSQPAALFCWLNEWMNDMTHPSDPSISIQQKYYFLLLFYFPD